MRRNWFERFIKKYFVISTNIVFPISGCIHFHQRKNCHVKDQNGKISLIVQVHPKTERDHSLQLKAKWEYASNILLIKNQLKNIPIQLNWVMIHCIVYQHLLTVVYHIPDENYYTLRLVVEKICHQEKHLAKWYYRIRNYWKPISITM